MNSIFVVVITRSNLRPTKTGVDLMRLIERYMPAVVPNVCGSVEPVRESYSLEALHKHWVVPSFSWHSAVADGGIEMGFHEDQRGTIAITLHAPAVDATSLIAFLGAACKRFGGEFGLIHTINEHDLRVGGDNDTVGGVGPDASAQLYVTIHDLRRWLPDLFWTTYFGQPYVELFGVELIASAPAHHIHSVSSAGFIIQLSENPYDMVDDSKNSDHARSLVKEHLGKEHFFDPEQPERLARVPRIYRV